ncbi:MAG TPA: Gfo/Idh/MocA family oxidoreductase [Pirellulales bacterium]|jgi:predicted dehydrogenase|nr:Gfo/Idh/MocA family oxidoreductase [Pirellulales bacterium]
MLSRLKSWPLPSLVLFNICAIAVAADAPSGRSSESPLLRAGIIGLDTSHAVEFTKLLNDPKAAEDLAGVRVVAAFPGGSDISSSRDRLAKLTEQVKGMGVELVDSIPALLDKVDVVLLESVDGRPHLEQARPVFKAGKPLFIDKPLAGSLADALAIADLGEKTKTPWFSSSALRFARDTQAALTDPKKIGAITGCDAWSPCHLEATHPDLYWYGIHGVETLYTIMGTGCETVSRAHTDGTDLAIGVWKDGRIGTFRGIRDGKQDYGATIFGKTGIATAGHFEGYRPLVVEIVRFFKTRQPPVRAEETIEMMTFMEAADESRRQGGEPVKLADVLAKAREQAKGRE